MLRGVLIVPVDYGPTFWIFAGLIICFIFYYLGYRTGKKEGMHDGIIEGRYEEFKETENRELHDPTRRTD